MPALWTWYLHDAAGNSLGELSTASGRSIAFNRNGYDEAVCSISHDDPVASLLLNALMDNGVPSLRCYRRAVGASVAVRQFAGYLAPFAESAEETSVMSLIFRSPFGRLIGDGGPRGRFTAASVVFAATDAGLIAKSLIDTANAESPTGLVTNAGLIQATKTRDRTYQYANVGTAITDLSRLLDGFDFAEDYTVASGTTLAQLSVVAAQGIVRPDVRFEYGDGTIGNVRSVGRTTQPPINKVRVIGANGLAGEATDAASNLKYGLWMLQLSQPDVSEQATLNDKAQARLRPAPVKTLTFAPDLSLDSCPKFFDDFGLADTVALFARRHALLEDASVRVNGVVIPIDDDGLETFQSADYVAGDDLAHDVDELVTTAAVEVEIV